MLAIVIPNYKITFFEATSQSLANRTEKRFKVYFGDDVIIANNAIVIKAVYKYSVVGVSIYLKNNLR